ncbi:MAG: hypothetical protein HFF61_11790 [Oscillospiraceae bacterium]|nr:hypothetical protein [Oscillospiraceae bacterium]
MKTDVGAHSVRLASSNMAALTERAHNVRPYNRYRRRVRSCAVNLRTSLSKLRRVLWFLGGRA